MNTLLYYEICFFASVILTIIYIYLWHDGIDVNMTCLFVLLPIVNLGCIWMFWAPTVEIAIIANKIVYLAGCFWPLLATKAILSLCHLNIKKAFTLPAFILAFVFYGFALTSEKPGALYKSITAVEVDGRIELFPEYGWMHTVIYAIMILYVLVGIISLVYAMKNKVRASITNMRMMLIGELVTVVVFFIYGVQKLAGSPAILYVVSMIVFLVAGYRSYYYNIDSSVMDTIVREEKLGYITFDKKKHLLGCNQVAEKLFPELRTVRTDKALDNLDGIKATINECLEYIEKEQEPISKVIPCGDRFIRMTADLYYMRGNKESYRIIMEDDTDHQNLVSILNREKDDAVQEKIHVSNTLYRYVDPNIADKILHEDSDELSKGVERNVAVMFADIRGFTSYSENKSPREVLELLNMIIEVITSCVMDSHGTVDKIIGDCVMAIWADNDDEERSAYVACRAAMEIQKAMDELGKATEEKYGARMHVGIGINYGIAIVGNVGTKKRSDYTAIGDTVNVASRLESLAEKDEVLVTAEVAKMLEDKADFSEYKHSITLKGRSSETQVFKLEKIK